MGVEGEAVAGEARSVVSESIWRETRLRRAEGA